MRLINALGPWPINTGRNIGSPAAGADGAALACPDGVALPCDHARSTTDNKAIKENAKARMDRYASGARRFFKGECFEDSLSDRRADYGDPLAFELPGCATRNLLPPSAVVLKAYVPDFEVEGVIEGAVNRMPVTKTGNPFCRSIDLSKCLAQTEAGRILQKHF